VAAAISAANSYAGQYVKVYRGRSYVRHDRQIEITLGEAATWQDGRWVYGEQHEFTFDSLDDATAIAKAILAEVKLARSAK